MSHKNPKPWAIVLEVKPTNRKEIERFFWKTKKEFDKFFDLDVYPREILLIDSRKDMNKIKKRKTADWEIGGYANNAIFILKPEKFEKESSHKKQDFWPTLKHEIVHLYYGIITGTSKPYWLNEGLAVYLAKQRRTATPENVVNVIKSFDTFDKNDYGSSGRLVELLMKRYGKDKMLTLLRTIDSKIKKQEFSRSFKKIYGFELNEKELMKRFFL